MTGRQDCWEYMTCGREPGGARTGELGVCPAATEKALDGVHGGRNAGRACWVVAGTLCGGRVAGSYSSKRENCFECPFYTYVHTTEWPYHQLSRFLLAKLDNAHSTPQEADEEVALPADNEGSTNHGHPH